MYALISFKDAKDTFSKISGRKCRVFQAYINLDSNNEHNKEKHKTST